MARNYDWRPLTKTLATETQVRFNPDGVTEIRTVGDEKPTLDLNHELRNLADRGWIMGGDMRRVASIPPALIYKWLVEEGIDVFNPEHGERVMRKLNDPDYADLRTAPGRLAMTQNGENFR